MAGPLSGTANRTFPILRHCTYLSILTAAKVERLIVSFLGGILTSLCINNESIDCLSVIHIQCFPKPLMQYDTIQFIKTGISISVFECFSCLPSISIRIGMTNRTAIIKNI